MSGIHVMLDYLTVAYLVHYTQIAMLLLAVPVLLKRVVLCVFYPHSPPFFVCFMILHCFLQQFPLLLTSGIHSSDTLVAVDEAASIHYYSLKSTVCIVVRWLCCNTLWLLTDA